MPNSSPRIITYADAVREALTISGQRNHNILFLAEGISDPACVFGTTKGLKEDCPGQTIEMPLSENGIVGTAVGAALAGKRPVISFQRVEFALLALEELVNNAAKAHYISNGYHRVPLVLRLIIGRGWGQGPEHSQSLESVFAHFPGLKVLMPSRPADVKGLMTAAIEDDNPVVILEHRWCHYATGAVPEGYFRLPLDGPEIVREGRDITLVATSYPLLEALRAAEALALLDIEAEVIDLRMLRPLLPELIHASVSKTGRLMTVDTGWWRYGVGAEIIAEVASYSFAALRSPPCRLGLPEHPVPSSRGMIPGIYPDAAMILTKAALMIGRNEGDIASVRDNLIAARGGLPIDVPDPFFKGPF